MWESGVFGSSPRRSIIEDVGTGFGLRLGQMDIL